MGSTSFTIDVPMKSKLITFTLALLAAPTLMAVEDQSATAMNVKAGVSRKSAPKIGTGTGLVIAHSARTSFIVNEPTRPVTYRYGKGMTFVTKGGEVIPDEDVQPLLRVGMLVTVHYVIEDTARIVTHVEIGD